jgi:hypothetical protein
MSRRVLVARIQHTCTQVEDSISGLSIRRGSTVEAERLCLFVIRVLFTGKCFHYPSLPRTRKLVVWYSKIPCRLMFVRIILF